MCEHVRTKFVLAALFHLNVSHVQVKKIKTAKKAKKKKKAKSINNKMGALLRRFGNCCMPSRLNHGDYYNSELHQSEFSD